jgi:hypothetical protein
MLCGLLFSGCKSSSKHVARAGGPPKNDVEFAKEVFQLLAEGDEAVEEMLDWEHMKVNGILDVGAGYRNITEEDERDSFRKAFIKGYANNFNKSGGRVENLSNWREQSRDSSNTVVAAEGMNRKLVLFTVTHINGQQKVSTFELK